MPRQFDILVIGGGHAGIEAAAAAARLGACTALISGNLDTIGKMSCNPAIGGMAKGQLAREVDALGGLMGLATDACGIQFRLLGTSKGPAMWSPRAQCDKARYSLWMKEAVERLPNCFPVQGDCLGLLRDGTGAIAGVELRDGRHIRAPRVILTTGTFLGGLLHQGETKTQGGRMGCAPALGLSASLAAAGLKLIRQKTGTPMRLLASTIDWSLCDEQPGDAEPRPFSFLTARLEQEQIPCWSCYSTPEAHAVIRANLDRAPLFNGQIDSIGPRYCPSIEDKVVRFADRERHHLFLEPEGRDSHEIYVNGLSTSLPMDVQDAVLRAIPALREAHVLRYGYAVEYDAVPATQLDHRLAVRGVPGLFLAGQINGTSGYEEAAVQGLLAGANAALSLAGKEPLILGRDQAYAGVLVDDLVVRAPEEPYRMFTSRAEHRLHLRADNADRRLGPLAAAAGLISAERAAAIQAKEVAVQALLATCPAPLAARVAGEALDLAATTALVPALSAAENLVAEQAWIELRYGHYLARQDSVIRRMQQMRDFAIPAACDYTAVPSLSSEGRHTLARRRPHNLGEAGRLPGVSQSDVEILWAWLSARAKRNHSTSR
jgi:tRNA uridine 5-carboxymethylaminomethyl modification enzyme